ncbi:sigma 54-interacting transcriptional regulator [Chelatococcus sambhunathii]|uniref:Sigma 54-interacting transcriptional regulator n=1 Tax=Chelatococcus sambhunathii TaxID=363953 RepID=A0ABU1DD79_9HYPH|nr:sigma 54-interacting transcriptional regulator [Chelatococcus sambhunathii]MDR4306054.1 sigma 54-interacting transcriptional regulator [Chelatococcus sambhunathii]
MRTGDLEVDAFRVSSDAVLIVDPFEDRILVVNPAACALLGRTADALAGSSFAGLHPGQTPALVVFTDAVLTLGRHWTRTLTPALADDRTLRLEYVGARIDRDGRRLVAVTMVDLDERRRRDTGSEAELYIRDGIAEWRKVERFFQEVERENQLILKAAGEGVYGVNAEGATTFLNPAAERMLGWKAEELVGRNMHATVHHHHPDGSNYDNDDCPIYEAFRDGAVHTVTDEVFWKKDGTPLWVEYTSTPIRDRGVVVGAVVVFRDIGQRREADAKLKAALAEVDALRERLELENAYLQEEIRLEGRHRGIIGKSAAIQTTLRQVELVAPTDAAVLITGESGTGKELIARAIHEASARRERPMIRVNCAAIPRELFESEFFGHAKGAFTGALRDRVGRFELADGGTLFLDEVGEIPLEQQSKLLRVLQEGQIERVGEERTRKVDVRVIAATNRDLDAEVRRGAFRRDLFFRLNVFPIHSAPLRDRPEDIPLLALHILKRPGRAQGATATLSERDVRRLTAYHWPGNVRELENVIERALILARDGRLRIDLPGEPPPAAKAPETHGAPGAAILSEDERRARDLAAIRAALKASGGRVSGAGGAAERLGLKPTTLASRMKVAGIDPADFRRRGRG